MWRKRCTRKGFLTSSSRVSFCFRPRPIHSLQAGESGFRHRWLKIPKIWGSRSGEKWFGEARPTLSSSFTFRFRYFWKNCKMKKGPVLETTAMPEGMGRKLISNYIMHRVNLSYSTKFGQFLSFQFCVFDFAVKFVYIVNFSCWNRKSTEIFDVQSYGNQSRCNVQV